MSKLTNWIFLLALILFASAFYLTIPALFPQHWGTVATLFILPVLALPGICLSLWYQLWGHLLGFITFFLSFPLAFLVASLFEALTLNPPIRLENPIVWVLVGLLLCIPLLTYRIVKEMMQNTWCQRLTTLIISGLYLHLLYLTLQLFW